MIDKTEIDRLNATPIEAVAERLGLEVFKHRALCPFHDDSRPSLTFNTYTNRYRCFVCDAHGGVIDLVMHLRHCTFPEAIGWIKGNDNFDNILPHQHRGALPPSNKDDGGMPALDLEWLNGLMQYKILNDEAKRFLFEERKIDPRVVDWCGLTSIAQPTPCWRFGKPFYDAPSLLIPYYDEDGRLLSVQGRYLGQNENQNQNQNESDGGYNERQQCRGAADNMTGAPTGLAANGTLNNSKKLEKGEGEVPRFRFPRGSSCHVYGLQILKTLQPGEELWITEGCSDCWAMLSSGKKAIAIPSATLLKDRDLCNLQSAICNLHLSLHMYPDNDAPGERLFLALRSKLPQLIRHQLPKGVKDFGEWWATCN